MPLTNKQEKFARLIALDGLNQSEAYRQAYNVGPDTPGTTTWDVASELARHSLVAPRIAALKASLEATAVTDAASLVRELLTIGNVTIDPRNVRAADKVAALDKVAKILGLYKEQDRFQAPAAITQVVVMLHHGGEDRLVVEQASPGAGPPEAALEVVLGVANQPEIPQTES